MDHSTDCGPDRIDCDDVNAWECYNFTLYNNCCQTCSEQIVQPEVPGCEFGDRVTSCDVDGGILCYDAGVKNRCCSSCQSYETGNPDCPYGDKIAKCDSSQCHKYGYKRRTDCCATCPPQEVTSQGTLSISTTEWFFYTTPRYQSTSGTTENPSVSSQTNLPSWVIPAGVSIGGLIVLLLVIIVIVLIRRNKGKQDSLSPIDEKMYNEYKLSKRAPMAPPRPLSTEKTKGLQRQESAEYAYINPDDVEGPGDNKRRSGCDPLPPTPSAPAEYLDLNADTKYCYAQSVDSTDDYLKPENDQGLKRYNSYQLFPTSKTDNSTNDPEKQQTNDNNSNNDKYQPNT
ncbi:hypothetical protein ACF0H5_021231 [Mactra antiquata]